MFFRHLKRAGALALVLVTFSLLSLPAAAMPLGTESGVESAADAQSLWEAMTDWFWDWLGTDSDGTATINATDGGTTSGDGEDGGDAGSGLDPNG